MRRFLAIAAFLPLVATADEPDQCAFTRGDAVFTTETGPTQRMDPGWLITSGRAEVQFGEKGLVAKLYEVAARETLTHSLTVVFGTKPGKSLPVKTEVTATLNWLSPATETSSLSGSFEAIADEPLTVKRVLWSVVLYNFNEFVALNCRGTNRTTALRPGN